MGLRVLVTRPGFVRDAFLCKSAPLMERGAVTIYDSAILHYGTANRGTHVRALLNAVVAANGQALEEENYVSMFPARIVKEEFEWMQGVFNETFYQSICDGTLCEDSSDLNKEDTSDSNACAQVWDYRRLALQRRIEAVGLPTGFEGDKVLLL